MTETPIEVTLKVVAERRAIVASLSFVNRTTKDAFIEAANSCIRGTLSKNVFRIWANGEKVSYVGLTVKRGPPGPDEFIRLPPAGTFQSEVHLEEAYAFPEGPRRYTAQFVAYNQFPDAPGFVQMKSNEVVFTWTKQS